MSEIERILTPDTASDPNAVHAAALNLLGEALGAIDKLMMANQDDSEGIHRTLTILDQMARDIRYIKSQGNHLLVESLPYDEKKKKRSKLFPGYGLIEAKRKPTRTYDPNGVDTFLSVVASRAFNKAEDEQKDGLKAAVRAILDVLYKTEPKISSLKAYEVDPDDISTVEWTDSSPVFTPIEQLELEEAKKNEKKASKKK